MLPFAELPTKTPATHAEPPLDEKIGSALVRSILDSSPDCIKLISLDGRLVYMNRNGMSAMEIDDFGGVKNELWLSLWPDEAQDLLQSAIENASLGERSDFQAYCPTAHGTPRWWHVNVAPVRDAAGSIVNILATSRDITDRIQAENTLHERDLQLQAYAEKLTAELSEKEALIEQQRILSAEIDHRVKNSFALIGSILRLKMRGMEDSEASAALSDAANRIATLSRVHEQLHIDPGHHAVDLGPFMDKLIIDLSDTFFDASRIIAAEIVDQPVRSDVAVAVGLVTAELVSNALKHKSCDVPTDVTVSLSEDVGADTLTLRVADTGQGLPEGFDIENSKTLGMQICRTYANTLKGTLSTHRGENGGAVFTLSFPKAVTQL